MVIEEYGISGVGFGRRVGLWITITMNTDYFIDYALMVIVSLGNSYPEDVVYTIKRCKENVHQTRPTLKYSNPLIYIHVCLTIIANVISAIRKEHAAKQPLELPVVATPLLSSQY